MTFIQHAENMAEPAPTGLVAVLREADIVPLAMALIQASGDQDLLVRLAAHVKGPWDYSQTLPDDLIEEIRTKSEAWLSLPAKAETAAGPEQLVEMLSAAVGEPVSPDYMPLIRDQMQLDGARPLMDGWRVPPEQADQYKAVIVGAGVAGICAAIHFESAGIPYEIFEKNADIGGTWLENTYPGCAVDTPNHFYQFSFEPRNDWPHYFSKRAANLEYLQHCASKYGLKQNIRFGTDVLSAVFDEERKIWRIVSRNRAGKEKVTEARFLISAVGQLNRPSIPKLAGAESFGGSIIHTAEWGDTDIAGKRVGLVGTAASGVQFACAAAPDIERLAIFQRSANWIVRNPNIKREVSEAVIWALDNIPGYAAWYRFMLFWGYADGLFSALVVDPDWQGGNQSINATNARIRAGMERYIRSQLQDRPDLLDMSIPTFPPFGKRVLGDPGWYQMLKRENVELVSEAIASLCPEGIRTADGRTHELDVIVLATGFQAGRMLWPMHIVGRNGATIRERWSDDDPRAYLGVTVAEFPNLFVLYGPNTATGHGGSFTFLAECQTTYIMGCVRQLIECGGLSIEPLEEAVAQYNDDIDSRLKNFVWSHPSVTTWYKNKNGRITTNQPWRLIEYWQKTRKPIAEHYRMER